MKLNSFYSAYHIFGKIKSYTTGLKVKLFSIKTDSKCTCYILLESRALKYSLIFFLKFENRLGNKVTN